MPQQSAARTRRARSSHRSRSGHIVRSSLPKGGGAAYSRCASAFAFFVLFGNAELRSQELCPFECRPRSSVIAVSVRSDAGVSSVPELVRARVDEYARDSLPQGIVFPLANTSSDSVRVIDGLRFDILASWLDPLTPDDSLDAPRFGANCDYTAYFGDGWDSDHEDGVVGGPPQFRGDGSAGWLWVNHEYMSNLPPLEGRAPSGQHYTLARWLSSRDALSTAVEAGRATRADVDRYIEFFKRQLGGTWMRVLRDPEVGVWSVDRTAPNERFDATSRTLCRITGYTLSGPETTDSGEPLPANVVPGLLADCSGGQTPWGTIVTAEENAYHYYGDVETGWISTPAFDEGAGFDPGADISPPFDADRRTHFGRHSTPSQRHRRDAHGFLAEIDPQRPPSLAYTSVRDGGEGDGHRKLGAFGRARWENTSFAVGADLALIPDEPIVAYGADDRAGGRVYKFVSRDPYRAGMTKREVRALVDEGSVWVAHFADLDNATGTKLIGGRIPTEPSPGRGQWIRLAVDASEEAPNAAALGRPGTSVGAALRDRVWNGIGGFPDQNAVLRALYTSANKIGARELNRPEDVEYVPRNVNGEPTIYVALTGQSALVVLDERGVLYPPAEQAARAPRRSDRTGSVLALREDDPASPARSRGFAHWVVWAGSQGRGAFSVGRPDNLLIDSSGGVWFTSDDNFVLNGTADSLYYIDLDPAHAVGAPGVVRATFGLPFRIIAVPSDAEPTGPSLASDEATLFLSVQHPGEDVPSRWPNEGFELQFDAVPALVVTRGRPETVRGEVVLSHVGESQAARGWSLAVRANGAFLESIGFSGTDAAAVIGAGVPAFERHEIIEGRAVASVLLAEDPAITLPAGRSSGIARFELSVDTDAEFLDSVTLEFDDPRGEFGALEIATSGGEVRPRSRSFTIAITRRAEFVRGDTTGDDGVSLTDPIRLFLHLFRGNPSTLDCRDAADADDDGKLTLADGIYSLNYLFRSGIAPPSPYPDCGEDPSADDVDCATVPLCP
jgi:secreted PhoX family phosphatase